MGECGRDPTRGDDHRRLLPPTGRGGPARHPAVPAAELPQPGQHQPRRGDGDGQPDGAQQPHHPRHPVHSLLQRGEQPAGVVMGDGQHRTQPQQDPDPAHNRHGGGAGQVQRSEDPVHPAAVPAFPSLLRPCLPVSEPLVVPGRFGRAHQPLVAGVGPRLPPPPQQHEHPGHRVDHRVAGQPADGLSGPLVGRGPPDHGRRVDHDPPSWCPGHDGFGRAPGRQRRSARTTSLPRVSPTPPVQRFIAPEGARRGNAADTSLGTIRDQPREQPREQPRASTGAMCGGRRSG